MEELYEELQALEDGVGDFVCSGYLQELPLPGLYIKKVGDICLPVQEGEQVKKIIAEAKKAPFGLGEETVVDESVRKSWQLDPKQVTFKNKRFSEGLKRVVETVKEQLGCNKREVQAHLYKVLLYEKGGHFKAHRDTEKQKGMFGTMIIQLPSSFEGGKLVVRHGGKEKEVKFDGEQSLYCCKYAAHYSDCEHEITEIQKGYRLALVYSLCWNAMGAPPSADTGAVAAQNVASILPSICAEERTKFAWFLAHKYSSASMSGRGIQTLKGHDAAVAKTLQKANELLPEEQKFDFHIAMVTRQLVQFGECGEYQYGPNVFDEEEEDINIEGQWYTLNGAKQKMGSHVSVDFENEVVNYQCPPNTDSDDYKGTFWGDTDEEENSGPTGNEGASRTCWYRSYAIFAWPKANSVHMMCESGYEAAVDWLVNEFSQVKGLPDSHPSYQQVMAHLKVVLNFATSNPISLNRNGVCSMLTILAGLHSEAAELANLFLTDIMANVKTHYCLADDAIIPSLVHLAVSLQWLPVSDAILKLFQLSPVSQYGRWAVFLKKLLETMNEKRKKALGENNCFKSILLSLVDTVESSAVSKTIDSPDSITLVSKTASLLFLYNDAELLDKCTNAVLRQSNKSQSSLLLERLIETLSTECLGTSPFWLKLLQSRIKQLEKVEQKGTPPFTWNQSKAVVHGHPEVQAFLRGPTQSLKYQAFNGIGHARNWASKHFGQNCRWSNSVPSRSYSADVTTSGTGRNAFAMVVKTRVWYDMKIDTIRQQMKELSKLQAMVNAVTSSNSTTVKLEPAPKKRALSPICIN